MTWIEHAACGGLNPALFHPNRGESIEAARAVCATCTVRTNCLEWALTTGQRTGIWGGLTAQERLLLRRRETAQ